MKLPPSAGMAFYDIRQAFPGIAHDWMFYLLGHMGISAWYRTSAINMDSNMSLHVRFKRCCVSQIPAVPRH
eukprot:9381373-Pyramimonas_sp.AAC.1